MNALHEQFEPRKFGPDHQWTVPRHCQHCGETNMFKIEDDGRNILSPHLICTCGYWTPAREVTEPEPGKIVLHFVSSGFNWDGTNLIDTTWGRKRRCWVEWFADWPQCKPGDRPGRVKYNADKDKFYVVPESPSDYWLRTGKMLPGRRGLSARSKVVQRWHRRFKARKQH